MEILSQNKNVPILEAVKGRYLYKGDLVRTFKNSSCVIMFDDQTSMFAMGSFSEVKLRDLKNNIKKINFNYGSLYIENTSQEDPFFIFTRSSQILSKKSSGLWLQFGPVFGQKIQENKGKRFEAKAIIVGA